MSGGHTIDVGLTVTLHQHQTDGKMVLCPTDDSIPESGGGWKSGMCFVNIGYKRNSYPKGSVKPEGLKELKGCFQPNG